MMDDYDGQMIIGDLVGLKLPDIRLTGEEKPRKTSPRKLVLTGNRTRARCVASAHATTCPTAVDETSCKCSWFEIRTSAFTFTNVLTLPSLVILAYYEVKDIVVGSRPPDFNVRDKFSVIGLTSFYFHSNKMANKHPNLDSYFQGRT